jgi:hypothetical protein
MSPLPNISHRLFAAALANNSERAAAGGKMESSGEAHENLNRQKNETKNLGQSIPPAATRRFSAAAGAGGIEI